MRKILAGSLIVSSFIFAGGDIAPMVAEEPVVETNAWSFELEPYLMLTNIDGDAKFRNLPTKNLEVDFGKILDNLDMAFMGHFEAHHQSGWGMWIDYGFMDLSNGMNITDYPWVSSQIDKVRMRQGVLEVMGLYRQQLATGYIEYLAGIRWWDNDLDLSSSLPILTRSRNIDWVDGIVGLRYTHILNDNWKLRVHGDIGGGGADITYGASVGIIYVVNDLVDIDVKYKATWVDYEEGEKGLGTLLNRDYFSYDTVTHGLIVGINFKF